VLGNGSTLNDPTNDETSPTQVGIGTTWASVSAGGLHTCAVTSAGTAWCWGEGLNGELGDGMGDGATAHDVAMPQQVGVASTWTAISAGYDHTCGVLAGAVNCWGSNSKGKLGIDADPSTTQRENVPTAVIG
jgi:alpha-tubulin suppressor-like RCC1 family protein